MSDQERGPQGEPGPGGRQGEPGVAGGEGRAGKAGQEGQRGRTGERPKLRWAPAIGYVIGIGLLLFLVMTSINADFQRCLERNQDEVQARATFRKMATLELDERNYPVPTKGASEFRHARAKLFRERADAGPLPNCDRFGWSP